MQLAKDSCLQNRFYDIGRKVSCWVIFFLAFVKRLRAPMKNNSRADSLVLVYMKTDLSTRNINTNFNTAQRFVSQKFSSVQLGP